MKKDRQTLVLLQSKPAWVSVAELSTWVEYSTESNFRIQILERLYKDRLIEYDKSQSRARISPLGSKEAEKQICKTRTP
jgi:hypothetical protein